MKGILGRKAGMTQVFTKEGKLIPVTVVEVEPNVVMQVKTVEKDGYSAIQLGVFDKKEKKASADRNRRTLLFKLPDRDSNPDKGNQNPLCYRYTIG